MSVCVASGVYYMWIFYTIKVFKNRLFFAFVVFIGSRTGLNRWDELMPETVMITVKIRI
jgi:hypothetical protein